ncbi:type II secretion system protein GspL [uncultured Roseobacter sp.]|uniref:type II secretion system protein GspL n=1 Tax=uncultured Roseobacter sp. TaxID=114847 RepID=UPI00262B5572|nr:type II secretion system protein GspL [uncultured Roseobacter sp.]
MFTQDDGGCAEITDRGAIAPSRALVPHPQPPVAPAVCTALKDRLVQAATAAHLAAPIVVPSANVSLFSVFLPVNTHRQRMKALRFALVDQLCEAPITSQCVLGPLIGDDHYLVAVCDETALAQVAVDPEQAGVALPDILGIPRPDAKRPAWNLWRAGNVIYVRASDGTGFVCRADVFATCWTLADKPELFSLTQALPDGVEAADISANPAPPHPQDLQLDLRHGRFRHRKKGPRRFLRFAAAALIFGAFGQISLLAADARALATIAEQRIADVSDRLAQRAPGLAPDQPLRLITAQLVNKNTPKQQDRFMATLNHASAALKTQADQITFRELRYGAREGVLTLLLQGSEFGALQAAEAALIGAGLRVTSGTATATESGAEVLLQIRTTS